MGILAAEPLRTSIIDARRSSIDRMQIAQARHESMILVTRDSKIMQYDVDVLEA